MVSPTPELSGGEVALRYLGHSMFQLFSPDGTTVLMDPHIGIGYHERGLGLEPNAVTVSHNHFDHDKVVEGGLGARIIRGLTVGDDEDWIPADQRVGDVDISGIPTFHDDVQGQSRGKNTMFLFEVAGLRLLHAGDLGHLLTEEQLAMIGRIDVLLIPVGGVSTIDPTQADEVIEQLQPKLVIPMHYKTDVLMNFADRDQMATVDDYLGDKTNVERIEGNTFVVAEETLPETTTVVVLDFK